MSKLILVCLLVSALSNTHALASVHEQTHFVTRDGVTLGGEWLAPDGDGTQIKSVALILQGSGNVGRDGDVSSPIVGTPYRASAAKLSAQIAEALANAGVASFRYDKRGFEDPTQLSNQITSTLVRDAEDAVQYLRARYTHHKTFLVGFSEGSLVATLVARAQSFDALFLLAPPVRDITENLKYQFIAWPTVLLRQHLPLERDDEIALTELTARDVTRLPLSGLLSVLDKPLETFDLNHDGKLSLSREIEPAYAHEGYAQLTAILASPGFSGWYNDLKQIPALRDFAGELKTPMTYVYQGLDDAQLNPDWISDDLVRFAGQARLRTFIGLGHCFSPMAGKIGEVKTSGPIDESVLWTLTLDARGALR